MNLPAELLTSIFVPSTTSYKGVTKQSLSRMTIAYLQNPDQNCGTARRIGHIDSSNDSLPLYRLKLKKDAEQRYMTLPELFVFTDGHFLAYDEWRKQ